MQNIGLNESQAGIKIARRNTNNLRYADNTTLMAESEEELKSLLMRVKEESEADFKIGSTSDVKPIMLLGKSRPLKSYYGSDAPTADQLCPYHSLASPSLLICLVFLSS